MHRDPEMEHGWCALGTSLDRAVGGVRIHPVLLCRTTTLHPNLTEHLPWAFKNTFSNSKSNICSV